MSNEDTLFTPPSKAAPTPVDQPVGGDENKDYLAELVGEGKKYKDEHALAKGAAYKDQHIANLEAEQAALREDLAKRLTLEEAVERMTQRQAQQVTPTIENENHIDPNAGPNANVSEIKPGMTPEEIQALVESKINEKEAIRSKESNLSSVKGELHKTWGDSFPTVLKSKADELGVGPEFLDDLASTNPKAFLKLVGVGENNSVNNVTPPASHVNPSATMGKGNVRDQAYYRNLRRTDPNTYWSAKTQSQIHKDADALGDSFFS